MISSSSATSGAASSDARELHIERLGCSHVVRGSRQPLTAIQASVAVSDIFGDPSANLETVFIDLCHRCATLARFVVHAVIA